MTTSEEINTDTGWPQDEPASPPPELSRDERVAYADTLVRVLRSLTPAGTELRLEVDDDLVRLRLTLAREAVGSAVDFPASVGTHERMAADALRMLFESIERRALKLLFAEGGK